MTTDLSNYFDAVKMAAARRDTAQTEPMILAARAALGNEVVSISGEQHPARISRPDTAFNPAARDGAFVWVALRLVPLALVAAFVASCLV